MKMGSLEYTRKLLIPSFQALTESVERHCDLLFCFQTRNRFEGTRSEVYELMKRIKESPQEYRQTSPISSEGYLYVQEKRTQDTFYDLFTDCHVICPVLHWLHC